MNRARNHPAYWAFLVHRVSGIALALFLPAHFWFLGSALQGAAALDAKIAWTEQPLVIAGEWLLVMGLAAHRRRAAAAGARVPAVEELAEDAGRARRRCHASRGSRSRSPDEGYSGPRQS